MIDMLVGTPKHGRPVVALAGLDGDVARFTCVERPSSGMPSRVKHTLVCLMRVDGELVAFIAAEWRMELS